jgi:hypothetical protein
MEVELCVKDGTSGWTVRNQKDGKIFFFEFGQRWNILRDQFCYVQVGRIFLYGYALQIFGRNLSKRD